MSHGCCDTCRALEVRVAALEQVLVEYRSLPVIAAPVRMIIDDAARLFYIAAEVFLGRRRQHFIARARWAVAWTAEAVHGMSHARIAKALNRDRSTITFGIEWADQERRADQDYRDLCDQLVDLARQRIAQASISNLRA